MERTLSSIIKDRWDNGSQLIIKFTKKIFVVWLFKTKYLNRKKYISTIISPIVIERKSYSRKKKLLTRSFYNKNISLFAVTMITGKTHQTIYLESDSYTLEVLLVMCHLYNLILLSANPPFGINWKKFNETYKSVLGCSCLSSKNFKRFPIIH